ncbi:hypothetical protein AXF42_Ash012937 [Apostasia shenzhenica]|uniref:C2 domain-containing protein n=1 Tax=Apostasia shenzhenica TaxID=1088818 RepID=A0A2I0ARN6_9ASPA|nr:hypothetical protein AXF42_Ash012937 [Apostasia shenzhenica]
MAEFYNQKEGANSLSELNPHNAFIGSLDIFVHQALEIQNICIYHKQDVYAKLCLTSNPDVVMSTKIINGGGRNPVFNDNLKLDVRTTDSSLKCEIWMMSRVKNYMEDQLLGFALVPLSEIIMANGKLSGEFSLSSTDLFHSPAGFVQLSISYSGSSPEAMTIQAPTATAVQDIECDEIIPCQYAKLEFPDLKVVNENKMMVSEYFGIPCANLDSQNGASLIPSDCDGYPDDEAGVRIVESFSIENSRDHAENFSKETPLSCISTDTSSLVTPATSQAISEPPGTPRSPSQKIKDSEVAEGDTGSSSDSMEKVCVPPLINVNVEPEQPVVQQEIVDMYLKSMQQFTESLAKMKLPMDIENASNSSVENGNANADKKSDSLKNNGGRVFYGSRAFF